MNALDSLLRHFSLHAGVFYTGNICGRHDFEHDPMRGHLHVIRHGVVELIGSKREKFEITEPTLVFLPRPDDHRLMADNQAGAEVVCGTVFFDGGGANPITDSLPDCVLIKLSETRGIEKLLDLMVEEAFNSGDGQQAALDRLCEILIIRLLRHCIAHGVASSGTLAGLADVRIAKVMQAMHDEPSRAWTLEDMAKTAGMSRARFAAHFKALTGTTPANYLASWRLMLAQKLMKKGLALIRTSQPIADARLAALFALTQDMVKHLGQPSAEKVKAFLDAGYTESHVLNIILAVAVKVLSNYTNHAFATEVDERFAAYKVA